MGFQSGFDHVHLAISEAYGFALSLWGDKDEARIYQSEVRQAEYAPGRLAQKQELLAAIRAAS